MSINLNIVYYGFFARQVKAARVNRIAEFNMPTEMSKRELARGLGVTRAKVGMLTMGGGN